MDSSAGPASAFADGWEQTPSLTALRATVERGARVRHVVAREAGLSESEMRALEHLVRSPIGPAELARRLEVSSAAVTGIVDRLVAHGHVRRSAHPADRRRTNLAVTPSGREEVLARLLPMFRALRRLDEGFTPAEREVVARYLDGAVAAFETLLSGGLEEGAPE